MLSCCYAVCLSVYHLVCPIFRSFLEDIGWEQEWVSLHFRLFVFAEVFGILYKIKISEPRVAGWWFFSTLYLLCMPEQYWKSWGSCFWYCINSSCFSQHGRASQLTCNYLAACFLRRSSLEGMQKQWLGEPTTSCKTQIGEIRVRESHTQDQGLHQHILEMLSYLRVTLV